MPPPRAGPTHCGPVGGTQSQLSKVPRPCFSSRVPPFHCRAHSSQLLGRHGRPEAGKPTAAAPPRGVHRGNLARPTEESTPEAAVAVCARLAAWLCPLPIPSPSPRNPFLKLARRVAGPSPNDALWQASFDIPWPVLPEPRGGPTPCCPQVFSTRPAKEHRIGTGCHRGSRDGAGLHLWSAGFLSVRSSPSP